LCFGSYRSSSTPPRRSIVVTIPKPQLGHRRVEVVAHERLPPAELGVHPSDGGEAVDLPLAEREGERNEAAAAV